MPLTPFHFGPSLLFGYLLRRRMDLVTFLGASVILDVRATLVFFGILPGHYHGPFHDIYLGAVAVALVFAGGVLLFARRFPSIAQRVSSQSPSATSVTLASVAGTWLHVTLDAFTHPGMQVFYPLAGNPLYGVIGPFTIYGLCVLTFLLFVGIVGVSAIRNRRKHGVVPAELHERMAKKGVLLGILIAVVVVGGLTGATTAIDKLNGPGTPDVTVERINDTHAAVAWTTEEPANGTLYTYVQFRCNGSWRAINSVNDGVSRTHLVVAPIYDLNESQINQTLASLPENSYWKQYYGTPPVRYEVVASVFRDGSGARKTLLTRNLSQACQ